MINRFRLLFFALSIAVSAPTYAALGSFAFGNAKIQNVVSKSATYPVKSSDDVLIFSGASWTATMETAVGAAGRVHTLVHNGTSLSQIYTLNTTAAQTIGGIASGVYKLATAGEILVVISDGANWIKLYHWAETARTAYTPTFVGFGTVSNVSVFYWRKGENLYVDGSVKAGTVTAAVPTISLPANTALNETSLSTAKTGDLGRAWGQISTTNVVVPATNRGPYLIGTQSGTTDSVFLSGSLDLDNDAANTFLTAQNMSAVFAGGNNTGWIFHFEVPITGWQP